MPIFKYQAHRGKLNIHNYYHRENDKRLYRRIWGGICPPGERPGAVVICAEEFTLRPPGHVFWVSEETDPSTDGLIQRALELKSLIPVDEFYTRRDPDFFRFLSFWNAGRKERGLKGLEIVIAPNSDSGNIAFHIGVLRNRLSPNAKSLHLGESKLLPGAFQEMAAGDVAGATSAQFPILSALGFVVAALDSYGADWDRDEPEAETEYDVESVWDR